MKYQKVNITIATIQIGNSDNKLSQSDWARYWQQINREIGKRAIITHFSGASGGTEPWQNACWVVSLDDRDLGGLRAVLAAHAVEWRQEPIAINLSATTEFLGQETFSKRQWREEVAGQRVSKGEPQMQRRIGVRQARRESGWIVLNTDIDTADLLKRFGDVVASGHDRYTLHVDARYDYYGVLDWINDYKGGGGG